MSLAAFVPSEIVGAMVLEAFQKKITIGDLVSKNYEPLLSKGGDSCKIGTMEAMSTSTYTRNQDITYGSVDATSQILTIDQSALFAKVIDKVDIKQSALAIVPQVVRAASYLIASGIDNYLINTTVSGNAGIIGGSGGSALGTISSAISIYSAADVNMISGCLNYLGRIAQRMDENDVPYEGRYAIVPPWFANKLVQQRVLNTYDTSVDSFTNGRIGRCMGFDIRVSTILPGANVTTATMIQAGNTNAIEFAGYMVDQQYFPVMEKKVGEGVRFLYEFGAKAVHTVGIAMGYITQGD